MFAKRLRAASLAASLGVASVLSCVPAPAPLPPTPVVSAETPGDVPSPSDAPPPRHAATRVDADPANAAPPRLPAPDESALAQRKPKTHPFHAPLPPPQQLAKGLASRYANLAPHDCRRRLKAAGVPTRSYRGPAKGVATPLILTGPVGEVRFAVAPPSSPYGVFDCRMALTLVDLAKLLENHEVVGARVDNFYRPRARLPGKGKASQHRHGLAMDVVSFRLKDGRTLDVERDYHGSPGAPSCGPDAEISEESDEAIRLRNLLCDIARQGLFHHILTPNYDAAHKDHFHLDIKRDNRWYSVN